MRQDSINRFLGPGYMDRNHSGVVLVAVCEPTLFGLHREKKMTIHFDVCSNDYVPRDWGNICNGWCLGDTMVAGQGVVRHGHQHEHPTRNCWAIALLVDAGYHVLAPMVSLFFCGYIPVAVKTGVQKGEIPGAPQQQHGYCGREGTILALGRVPGLPGHCSLGASPASVAAGCLVGRTTVCAVFCGISSLIFVKLCCSYIL